MASTFVLAEDDVGQTIQVYTRFRSFVGKPSWLIQIRDVDNDQVIPYVYDISRGDNFWLAFTYGHNYLITASTMQFAPYRINPYRSKEIRNFCHLESNGRVSRGESLYITVSGDLTPSSDTYTCNVMRFTNSNFSTAPAIAE